MSTPRKKAVPHVEIPVEEDIEVLAITHVEEDLGDMSPERTAELWAAIDLANKQSLDLMCDEADRIIKLAQDKLRDGKTITNELRQAQDLMSNMESHVGLHRYTLPKGYELYSDRNVAFTLLAQINELALKGEYPKTSDGRGYSLTPMQHHVLWTH